MSDPTFIPDGYELDFDIEAVKGQHGAVKGKYRPLIQDERDELRAMLGKKPGELNDAIRAKLAERITAWDVMTPAIAAAASQPVPITADNLKRIEPRICDKLYWIICEGQADGLPFNHPDKKSGGATANTEAAVKN